MDTTAAAELGMGDVNGAAAFWHAGPPGPDHWGDPGDNADLLDDADDHVACDPAIPPSTALPSDFPASPSGTFARATEPPAHHLRSMPDATLSHSHAVPPHPSFSGGATGHGAGPPSGRANSSAAASPHFFTGGGGGGTGTVGSSPSGVGAVGRGRGMGSIFYKTKLCSRFRSGNCPYNTNCNFAHGMEELRKPPPGWEEFVASQELPPPSQSGQAGSGTAGGSTDSQVRFHKTRPCKKYFGEGNCPYGEKCNFLHDEQSVPRAVREAREAAVAANSGGVVPAPKVDTTTLVPATNGHLKETGGSTISAGSAPPNAPSNWKTRLCNKWETTGHCRFGDKCQFAHGSDEVQRYGGLSDANAPAVSDSKSGGTTSARDSMVSWHQRHAVGGASSAARSGFKRNSSSTWRGPHDISTIYGDWWVEDDDWPCGGGSTSHETTELEGDVVWREAQAQRRTPLPAPSSSTPNTVPFFRRSTSLEPSRQTAEQAGGLHK